MVWERTMGGEGGLKRGSGEKTRNLETSGFKGKEGGR